MRRRRVLTSRVESKPNSRMIKTKTIVIVLMVSSIIDKKLQRLGCRAEHRAMDLRGRTRTKRRPESFAVLFVFTLFSQAFEDRHFTEREICLCDGYSPESGPSAPAPRGS